MAKKVLKKTSKVLGGLGAAYMLTDLLEPKVTADPVEAAKDVLARNERVQRERVDRPPAPARLSEVGAKEPPPNSQVVLPPDSQGNRVSNEKEWEDYHKQLDLRFLKKGGKVSASRRGDGIAQRGKTRGKMV